VTSSGAPAAISVGMRPGQGHRAPDGVLGDHDDRLHRRPEGEHETADRARSSRIIEAAVALLDEAGLDGLSTPGLAARLGIASPSLCWHVRDKEALLDLVAEAICADAFAIDPTLPWRDQPATGLRQFRAMLLAHRDVPRLLRDRPPRGSHRLGHIETTLRILLDAGLTEADAAGIAGLLTAHVLDSVPATAPSTGGSWPDLAACPHLSRVAPALANQTADAVFELGVEIILDGLAARVASGP
jgi:TetR/AcrR family tetracycline transcriptional repressor